MGRGAYRRILDRALFVEYPEDRTSWTVEDQYLFGTDIFVAPLMEEPRSRLVYLPPGLWTDYQSGETHEGARWRQLRAGEGATVPHAGLAQCTDRMDWGEVELRVYGAGSSAARLFCLPEEGELRPLRLQRGGYPASCCGTTPSAGRCIEGSAPSLEATLDV